jgi:hypothetical protein
MTNCRDSGSWPRRLAGSGSLLVRHGDSRRCAGFRPIGSSQSRAIGTPKNLTAAAIDPPIDSYAFAPDGSWLVLAEDGFRVKLWDVAGDGRASVTVAADGDSQDLAVASTGTVAFLGQKADLLPEIWTMAPGRSPGCGDDAQQGIRAQPVASAGDHSLRQLFLRVVRDLAERSELRPKKTPGALAFVARYSPKCTIASPHPTPCTQRF